MIEGFELKNAILFTNLKKTGIYFGFRILFLPIFTSFLSPGWWPGKQSTLSPYTCQFLETEVSEHVDHEVILSAKRQQKATKDEAEVLRRNSDSFSGTLATAHICSLLAGEPWQHFHDTRSPSTAAPLPASPQQDPAPRRHNGARAGVPALATNEAGSYRRALDSIWHPWDLTH